MKNDENMVLTLTKSEVIDIREALFELSEANRDEANKGCKWICLSEKIFSQFKKQDVEQ